MEHERETDIAVIGLGAMGSATLWRLAGRGARVMGFERFAPGHDKGSSHGESRIIRTAYFEHPSYVPLLHRAFALWRELEAETGSPLLTQTGALMIGLPDSAVITGTLASVREHTLAHEVLDADELRRRYPQHRLDPDEVAVFEEQAGFLRPEASVRAAVSRAEALGAIVKRETVVERIEPDRDGVRVTAGGRTYHARHAIVSVGSWLGGLLPDLRLPLQVERQVLAWFPLDKPEVFAPARCPVYLHNAPSGLNAYGFPTLDETEVKIAVHHFGTTADPDTIDRGIRPEDLAPIEGFVAAYLNGVRPVATRGLVCMYTNTPDEHFLIGPAPGLPNVTLLSPCSGHGFKFMPIIGEIAADLALHGRTDLPIDLFRPDRFTQAASLA